MKLQQQQYGLNCNTAASFIARIHCKKELAVFPSLAGMSLIKLFLGGNNVCLERQPSRSINDVGKDDNSRQ
jgi:hypothetical protein